MGCEHYSRGCEIYAPCCNRWFSCRHCHNQECDREDQGPRRHVLDRSRIERVRCLECGAEQAPAQHCNACGHCFGAYTCLVCNYFDNDVGKRQFHCAQCGICRVGGRENFFHCDECGCCYETQVQQNHQCVANNLQQPCPLCNEVLFDSTEPLTVLECGHAMHSTCAENLRRAGMPACPLCLRDEADRAATHAVVDEAIALLAEQPRSAVPAAAEVNGGARGAADSAQRFCVFCRRRCRAEECTLGARCLGCGSFCD